MPDIESELAKSISRIWGYPGRIHNDARDLAKTLILEGWGRVVPASPDSETEGDAK